MNIRKMSDRDHVLKRSAMYIGSVDLTQISDYFLINNKMEYREVSYVPGLIKIVNEIVDNCVDVAIKSKFTSANEINIKMTADYVEVQDNGTGIPIQRNEDGQYLPELCWGHARAGSNFDDDENRTQIGLNGVGSFATNCFSTKFVGHTDDGKNAYTITFTENASTFTEKVQKTSGKTGTTVKFWPDLEKFHLTAIDEVHMDVIRQRLINLSMSFPLITFKFNGKKINISSFKKYVQMFGETSEIFEDENVSFAVMPNAADDFRQFSYVNGLKIPDGGTHIDISSLMVVNRIREKLVKKYKSIKPADIKNKVMIVMFMRNFKNTKFNSQSKEKITNSITEVNRYLNAIPYDDMVKKILRNKEFIDPITEVYRIKEEFKRRQELKGLTKVTKKIKSDKYLPSIGTKKYLMLVEGECLEENTEIMMADYSTKLIKEVNIGDKVISGDLSVQTIQAQTKLLKPTITIKTATSEIVCGVEHRLKVYDINSNSFVFVEARVIKSSPERYKIVKSKVNKDTHVLEVQSNDTEDFILDLGDQIVSYTMDDNFVIIREGIIMKVHSTEIIEKDLITLG